MPWIYDHEDDNSARYTLGPEGERTLLCFGINPSTATPERLDNTIKSVERIAKRHGYDAYLMLNVYPQRATNPDDLHSERDDELHAKNLFYIEKCFAKNKEAVVLAAWGTLIAKRPYLKSSLQDIYELSKKYSCRWKSIGPCSKAGHPHHPLYLKNDAVMSDFDIETYINTL